MRRISRRRFLKSAVGSSTCLAVAPFAATFGQAPAIVTGEPMRPATPSGLQIGDVRADRAVVWSRTDRPARLFVERSLHEDLRDAVTVRGPVALESTDHVARVDLTGLAPDRDVFIRVRFEDLANGRTMSMPLEGRFRTAPAGRRDVRFVWSGDTAGQGFGINPEAGGMRTYDTMRRVQPDFFIHCGDTIYADAPIVDSFRLADGTMWKNLVTEETSKVAESLREFRGRYAYNLLDENVRRFSAEVPQVWQWDDHEVLNNWWDGKDLSHDSRYTQKNVRLLAARARQAFLEYAPMRYHGLDDSERIYRRVPYGPLLDVLMLDARSYRGPNTFNRQDQPGADTAFLGAAQLAWLKHELSTSQALWKVVSCDMPIGLLVGDGRDGAGRPMFEAVANGDGPALGRELEFADLLRFLKREAVANIVWITADVHYTAAHHYDPQRAVFDDFDPFWEFVSGPLNAGSFGPAALDNTFGPQVVFQKTPPAPNTPPTAGFQFFGQMDIDGQSGDMTVTLKDVAGASLFVKTLAPAGR
jgi:alkaline phosphatase D